MDSNNSIDGHTGEDCKPDGLPHLSKLVNQPTLPELELAVSNFCIPEHIKTNILKSDSKLLTLEEERLAIQSQLSSLETSESSDSKDELKEITPSSSQSTCTNELQSVTVKVTNLSKGVTKQELKEMIKYSPNGISAEDIFGVCMMQGGARSTNHAFVVCSTQSVAERVVDFLDSKQMGESDTHISAKVQKTQCDKPQVKSLPVVVKVYQIPKDFSEENIMGLIGNEISPHIEVHLKTSPDQEAYNYAWVNCPDRETARKVVGKLDQQLVEMQGSPSVHNPKKHTILARLQKGQYGLAINNIPKTISSTYLESDLMKADVQVDVTILCDVNSPTNHGYINCSTEDAAMRIRDKLNGAEMGGHRLSVRLNPKKRSYCQKPDRIVHRPTRGSPGQSVKLSNIPFNVTEMGFSLLGSNEKGFIRAKYIHSSPLAHGFLVFDSRENAKRAFDNLTKLGYKASLL
jgi:RNA recognition motif-containing protein